jgi:hypothetical protein
MLPRATLDCINMLVFINASSTRICCVMVVSASLAMDGNDGITLAAYAGHRQLQNLKRYVSLSSEKFKNFRWEIEISAYAVNRKAALKIGKPKNIRLGHFFRYGINGVFHAGGITAKIPPA